MSFFNKDINPFMRMFEQLSETEQEKYKQIGEYMYNIVNFESGQLIKTEQEQEFNSIIDALRSGLSINDLTPKEKELVEQYWSSFDNVTGNRL